MIKIEEVRELPFVGNWYRPPARTMEERLKYRFFISKWLYDEANE